MLTNELIDKLKWAENIEVDPLTGAINRFEPPEEVQLSGYKVGEGPNGQFYNNSLYQIWQAFLAVKQELDTIKSQLP